MALLRIGSRGSQLALWQANHIAALLQQMGQETEIKVIKTTGDSLVNIPITQVGTKGMFTKEIEESLAAGAIDLAVHSYKDLPTQLDPVFDIGAVLPREDARDALVSVKYASVAELPAGARVGTSSLRRQSQLRGMRPDISTHDLRGNVDTRLRKLDEGQYDAVLLAAAGLKRLGLAGRIREYISYDQMCPAPAQGALAVEIRAEDHVTRKILNQFDDIATRAATLCERSLLTALGGGCQVPIGALANFDADKRFILRAVVASPDGSRILREIQEGKSPIELGRSVAEALLAKGARRILDSADVAAATAPQQP